MTYPRYLLSLIAIVLIALWLRGDGFGSWELDVAALVAITALTVVAKLYDKHVHD